MQPRPFVKPLSPKPVKENLALREVLNKIKAPEPEPPKAVPAPIPVPAPISLDTLKNKIKESKPLKDRAASSEDMNKLKDLITAKTKKPARPDAAGRSGGEEITTPAKATPPPQGGEEIPKKPQSPEEQAQPVANKKKVKEVPEDVLRKILE